MIANEELLFKAAELNYNVLLTGSHGVGKTQIIKEVFTKIYGEINIGWRYFSASTLDPWVDFIGIPKNYVRESDGREVFGIIPPENFTGEENIQAIFFDEINRADPKTLNAIMELIQFRSINGRKFPNLKVIWAARNLEDGEYSVNKMDDAQIDRFQVLITMPDRLNISYFEAKYGKAITKISNKWWMEEREKHKLVSPRKMDDILQAYKDKFPICNLVPKNVRINNLEIRLENIHEIEIIASVIKEGKEAVASYFTIDKITDSKTFMDLEIIESIYPHLDIEECALLKHQLESGYSGNPKAPRIIHSIQNKISETEKKMELERQKALRAERAAKKYADSLNNEKTLSNEKSSNCVITEENDDLTSKIKKSQFIKNYKNSIHKEDVKNDDKEDIKNDDFLNIHGSCSINIEDVREKGFIKRFFAMF